MNRKSGKRGFTLMELIVTLSIMALLTSIAALSINQYRTRMAVKKAATIIDGTISEIRTAARTRQQTIRVNVDAGSVTGFVDANSDGIINAGEELILTSTVPEDIQLSGVAPFVIPGGFALNAVGGLPSSVQIRITRPSDLSRQFMVSIGLMGHITVERSEDTGANWTRAW